MHLPSAPVIRVSERRPVAGGGATGPVRSGRLSGGRAGLAAILVVLILAVSLPPHAAAGPLSAVESLGAPQADGVTVTGQLANGQQAAAYVFSVHGGPSTAHIYVGDLWYDVEVRLWQLPASGGQEPWAMGGCDRAAGCLVAASPSSHRVVQFVQPKLLLENVEPGSYAVVIQPRDGAAFDAARAFTVRVAVTPPVCGSQRAADGRYVAALTAVPEQPRRFDLLTLSAHLLPPYSDLYEFEWLVDGRPLGTSSSPVFQAPASELGGRPGEVRQVRVVARGIRPYPDVDQPDVPSTVVVDCGIRID